MYYTNKGDTAGQACSHALAKQQMEMNSAGCMGRKSRFIPTTVTHPTWVSLSHYPCETSLPVPLTDLALLFRAPSNFF